MKHWAGVIVLAALSGCGLFPSVSPPEANSPPDVVFIPERPAIGETFTLQLRSIPEISPFPDGTYEVTFQEIDQSGGTWNFFAPKTPPLKRLPPDEPHLAATFEVKDGFGSVEIPLTATVPNQWGESFEVVPGKWVGVSIRTDQRGTSRGFVVREK